MVQIRVNTLYNNICRLVQVWFQNARAKWRRNIMRQENSQMVAGSMQNQNQATPSDPDLIRGHTQASQALNFADLFWLQSTRTKFDRCVIVNLPNRVIPRGRVESYTRRFNSYVNFVLDVILPRPIVERLIDSLRVNCFLSPRAIQYVL